MTVILCLTAVINEFALHILLGVPVTMRDLKTFFCIFHLCTVTYFYNKIFYLA